MIRVHHAGKMGDIIYVLPVLRALSRIHGCGIHLTTSGLCWQLVPLLWEQSYIDDVALDEDRAYQIPFETGITTHWEYYRPHEGYNLSLQPKHYQSNCPISWTRAAAWLCGLDPDTTFEHSDFVGLPSLVNHRNWHHQVDVRIDGAKIGLTKTMVVAPEVETLASADDVIWLKLMTGLMQEGWTVLLVGRRPEPDYFRKLPWTLREEAGLFRDLRGCTTVSSLARLIAEAAGFIGAHSLPWHLARQAGTPAVCLQGWREGLRRCIPLDTPPERCPWVEPEDWHAAIQWMATMTPQPTTGG